MLKLLCMIAAGNVLCVGVGGVGGGGVVDVVAADVDVKVVV